MRLCGGEPDLLAALPAMNAAMRGECDWAADAASISRGSRNERRLTRRMRHCRSLIRSLDVSPAMNAARSGECDRDRLVESRRWECTRNERRFTRRMRLVELGCCAVSVVPAMNAALRGECDPHAFNAMWIRNFILRMRV